MATTPDPTPLTTLPVAIHGQRVNRLGTDELLRYESLLDTADDVVLCHMQARRAPRLPETGDQATATLVAVLQTVSALTSIPTPEHIDDKRTLVHWVATSVRAMRDEAVTRASATAGATSMHPEAMATSLELISKLNGLLSGARG